MSEKRKISVVLSDDIFERFDGFCVSQGYKKSPLIARLIREHMDGAVVDVDGRDDKGNSKEMPLRVSDSVRRKSAKKR
jgi:hypothetical protein